MLRYNQKGGKQMGKKKKKTKKSLKRLIELLIAIGTLLTGIASLIQALK
jgi:hypothetical protein